MNKQMENLSVIIPVYNEEESLKKVIYDIRSKYPALRIIVINDGSNDSTSDILSQMQDVFVIHNKYNRGCGASIKIGAMEAETEYIITMDGDGQHVADNIEAVLQEFNGQDMIVGARTKESHQTLFRKPLKWLLKKIAEILVSTRIPDVNSGLRMVKRELLLKNMHLLPNGYSLSTTITLLLIKCGYKVDFVSIETEKRRGKSKVNIFSDGLKTVLLIARIIMKINPLRILAPISIGLFVLGGILFVWDIMISFNISDSTVLLIIAAIQILILGLLADQISLNNLKQ